MPAKSSKNQQFGGEVIARILEHVQGHTQKTMTTSMTFAQTTSYLTNWPGSGVVDISMNRHQLLNVVLPLDKDDRTTRDSG